MAERQLPTALIVVAVLFILGGVYDAITMIAAFAAGNIMINVGVLGLLVGPGLLRLSRGWRTCGLVLMWIVMILIPILTIVLLVAPGPLELTILGQPAGHAPKPVALLIGAAVFGIVFWGYRVLTRPDVRRLFGVQDANRPDGAQSG